MRWRDGEFAARMLVTMVRKGEWAMGDGVCCHVFTFRPFDRRLGYFIKFKKKILNSVFLTNNKLVERRRGPGKRAARPGRIL